MSTNKKIDTILSLIEICESNLKNVKSMLSQYAGNDIMYKNSSSPIYSNPNFSSPQTGFSGNEVESIEGYFDGENMIGDDGKNYTVPQNYASKSQLVVGDKMKWSLVKDAFDGYREVFKLTHPVLREKIIGKFVIEGNNYGAIVEGYPQMIKILKASITFAIKNLGLAVGGKVALYVPKTGATTLHSNWGAFLNVVNSSENFEPPHSGRRIIQESNIEIIDSE